MISHEIKQLYYVLMKLPMALNGKMYRTFKAPRLGEGQVKVHLGPGQKNYLPGWINLDANLLSAKIDIWADLRDPLPFRDCTVDAFYSHHVIEHLPDPAVLKLLHEMYRCLKPGGIIRIGGPNGDAAISKFIENDVEWFGVFPDRRESIGGRLANFICCRGEHATILTRSYLTELTLKAGFVNQTFCAPCTETRHPLFITESVLNTEHESTPNCPHTLILEAEKM